MSDPLHRLLDRLPLAQKRRVAIYATLGDGEGNLYPTDPDGNVIAGYVWARIQLGEEGGTTLRQVRCLNIQPINELKVVLDYGIDKNLEVVSGDPTTTIDFMAGRGVGTAAHAWAHGILGPDTLWVQAFQFLPLLAHPTFPSSLNIDIEPYSLVRNGVPEFYTGERLDLTSYLPDTSGQQVPVVIGLDVDTLAATVTSGTPSTPVISTGYGQPFTGMDVAAIATPSNVLRIAGIRLYGDQTNIIWTDWIVDLRQTAGGSSVSLDDSALYLAWRGNR